MLQHQTNKIIYSAPSNIAFVKYWGKYGRQLPMNPSISMTLSGCKTICSVEYTIDEECSGISEFLFEGQENQKFKNRLQNFLDSVEDVFPLGKKLNLKISTENTFPHSAGIASSASAMAAFTACLAAIEFEIQEKVCDGPIFLNRVSFLARLASGSACRSVYPRFASWGELETGEGTNEFALPLEKIHENFNEMGDAIVIVSGKEKEVSSSAGHELMNTHFYKDVRKDQAQENMRQILNALKIGDYDSFGEILENEALTLHALMMTSYPSYILLEPNSLEVIKQVKNFRKKTGLPLYFTIDAGPNIHLIYPLSIEKEVKTFLEAMADDIYESVLYDKVGNGLQRILL
jgi:diphosphomevalonate decarboxylase